MGDERPGPPIGQSSLRGFVWIVALGLALASAGCAQLDRDSSLAPAHDHVWLPSLAPVVQAVTPAVVHVSAIQRSSVSSNSEEYTAGLASER
jgi:hypothetical protein